MTMQWFRMYTDFLDDPKMISLAFEDQRHFIGLLALKCSGVLDQPCDEHILNRIVAQKLWIDNNIIDEVKKRLMRVHLIDQNWQPIGWDKRQFVSNQDVTRNERQKRFREKVKNERNALRNNTHNTEITLLDTDTDTEKEKDIVQKTKLTNDFKFDLEALRLPPGYSTNLKKPIPPGFDEFWKRYPKRVSKAQAIRTWHKIKPTPELLQEILAGVDRAIEMDPRFRDDLRFCPQPSTWLNAMGWADELKPKSKPFTDVHLAPTERAPAPQRMRIWT